MVRQYPVLFVLKDYHLEKLVKKLRFSNHAKQRIKERFDYHEYESVEKAIREADFAYVAGDRVINIGLLDGTQFRIAQNKHDYCVITYLEPSMSRTPIRKKYRLACRGGMR